MNLLKILSLVMCAGAETDLAAAQYSGLNRTLREGFVYHYGDVSALAGMIECCCRDRGLVRLVGTTARETVQGCSIGHYPGEVWQRLP